LHKKFTNIITINNNHDKNNLGPYLAGLIEGDGHIYTPSSYRDKNGKKNTPSFRPRANGPGTESRFSPGPEGAGAKASIEICFDIKDLPLFIKIKEILEGGYIAIRPNNKSGRLFIKKKVILLKLINLINGHMRTPKIEALHRIIQ
jgi:hypothetical protein